MKPTIRYAFSRRSSSSSMWVLGVNDDSYFVVLSVSLTLEQMLSETACLSTNGLSRISSLTAIV